MESIYQECRTVWNIYKTAYYLYGCHNIHKIQMLWQAKANYMAQSRLSLDSGNIHDNIILLSAFQFFYGFKAFSNNVTIFLTIKIHACL